MSISKEEKYKALLPIIQSLLEGETDEIAQMANLSAILQQEFGFWWTGFYRVMDRQLVLGPFQGPIACTRIAHGKGVCGTAWAAAHTIIVPDVEQFPGHIACSSESRSEIVVPVWRNNEIVAVLDIDSRELNTFDAIDEKYLEQIVSFLYPEEQDIWFAAGCFWGAQKFFKLIKGEYDHERARQTNKIICEDKSLTTIGNAFNLKRILRKEKSKNIDNINMSVLSMGMSGDYELAVRYGSNKVRIGSALFGARVYK